MSDIVTEGTTASFLEIFNELVVTDIEKRDKATLQLVNYLRTKKESADQPDYPNMSRDMIYTLKRLCRGICSSRDCARQGFSVALTCILRFFPEVTKECVYKEVFKASDLQNGMNSNEKRDQWIGRIFGILSIYRSACFLSEKPTESDIELTKKCASELVRLYGLKSWMREICAHGICTMIELSHEDLIPIILNECTSLYEEVSGNEDEELITPLPLCAASLQLILEVQLILHKRSIEISDENLHRIFIHNAEVSPSRLMTLMPIYMQCSSLYPKLHKLWTVSITYIRTFSETPDVTLMQWWGEVCKIVLTAKAEHKGMCFKVCRILFPLIPASSISSLLNKKLLSMIRSNAMKKTSYLHHQALHLLYSFIEMCKDDAERRVSLLIALMSTLGNDFDKSAHTDIMKKLFESLNTKDIQLFMNHCLKVLLQPIEDEKTVKTDEMEEEEEEGEEHQIIDTAVIRRKWALDNLYHLVLMREELDVMRFIRLLFVISCLKKTDEDYKVISTVDYCNDDFITDFVQYCSPELNDTIITKASQLLSSLVASLSTHVNGNDKKNIGMKDNQLYVYLIMKQYEEVHAAAQKNTKVAFIHEWEERDIEAYTKLVKEINTIHKVNQKKEEKVELGIERLYCCVLIDFAYQHDYSQFIDDLVMSCTQLYKKDTKQENERPIAVYLDIAIILVRTGSKATRTAVAKLFGLVSDQVQKEDIKELLNVFWNDEGIEEEEEDENNEDDMEISIDENGEEEEKEEMEEEEEEEEEKEEKKKDDEKEDMEEEEEDMDGELTAEELEAMKREDEGIINVLRIKKAEEAARKESKLELSNYKNHLLSLLEELIIHEKDSAIMNSIVVSLLEVNQKLVKVKNDGTLVNHFERILTKLIPTRCLLPSSFILSNEEEWYETMKKIITYSIEVSLGDPERRRQILQCNSMCLYFYARSIYHTVMSDEKNLKKMQEKMNTLMEDAFVDFSKKRAHLNNAFFETLFTRCSVLFCDVIPTLQKAVTEDDLSNYKKLEYLNLLNCILKNTNTKELKEKSGVMRYENEITKVKEWTKDKIDNIQKEENKDFRAQQRRAILNSIMRI